MGERFPHPGRVLLVGGTTIVLKGLRAQTADIDFTADVAAADHDEFIRVLRTLKEELDVNVEDVSPAHFIPLPAGHESRALFIGRYGRLDVYHFDPYSTALSKIERGTDKDFSDVRAMLESGLIEWPRLEACYADAMRNYGRESLRQDPTRFALHFDALRGTRDTPR